MQPGLGIGPISLGSTERYSQSLGGLFHIQSDKNRSLTNSAFDLSCDSSSLSASSSAISSSAFFSGDFSQSVQRDLNCIATLFLAFLERARSIRMRRIASAACAKKMSRGFPNHHRRTRLASGRLREPVQSAEAYYRKLHAEVFRG